MTRSKNSEIEAKGLQAEASCISAGYFPLASYTANEAVLSQWMRYLQAIRNPAYYPEGKLPAENELERYNSVLKSAFEGINRTKLAAYVVPDTYHLADICEIFETLNTTGTKVSTVDLIHSWLFADTRKSPEGVIQLRDWIDDLGQKEGAVGWASSTDRPELCAQIATACYVALDKKPKPRRVGRASEAVVNSVKAGDLLATPTEHWRNVIKHDTLLAQFLGDFQRVVASGVFTWKGCPYPVSAAVYVALRYHSHFEEVESRSWGRDDLDALYRAFFWLTALTGRYDQGFLTQIGTDIRSLRDLLRSREKFSSSGAWVADVTPSLLTLINKPVPSEDYLIQQLTDGRPGGALQKALLLPMVAKAHKDLLSGAVVMESDGTPEQPQFHHIYPRQWCSSNRSPDLIAILDKNVAGRDWVNSLANLMPLSSKSNNIWKAKVPSAVIGEWHLTYENLEETLRGVYIDKTAFEYLEKGPGFMREFWLHRAKLIAVDMLKRTKIVL